MLKGLMVGGFLANAANAGARADDAYALAQIARNTADILKSRLDHLREDFRGVIRSSNGFRDDDAGLRAVLRELLAAVREASPDHPFLDKANRDRMYGEAFGAAFQNESDRGWAPHVGNMKALESLVGAGADALRQVAPGHLLLDADEQALVYWEAWDSEAAKVDKAIREKNPWGAWLVDYASEIEKAAQKSYQARMFNKSTKPASMRKP